MMNATQKMNFGYLFTLSFVTFAILLMPVISVFIIGKETLQVHLWRAVVVPYTIQFLASIPVLWGCLSVDGKTRALKFFEQLVIFSVNVLLFLTIFEAELSAYLWVKMVRGLYATLLLCMSLKVLWTVNCDTKRFLLIQQGIAILFVFLNQSLASGMALYNALMVVSGIGELFVRNILSLQINELPPGPFDELTNEFIDDNLQNFANTLDSKEKSRINTLDSRRESFPSLIWDGMFC